MAHVSNDMIIYGDEEYEIKDGHGVTFYSFTMRGEAGPLDYTIFQVVGGDWRTALASIVGDRGWRLRDPGERQERSEAGKAR